MSEVLDNRGTSEDLEHTGAARAALALASSLAVLCIIWELWGAPTGSGTLALKVLPLLWPLWGMVKGRLRSHQVMCLWVWLYMLEGCVRVWSDPIATRGWPAAEIVLSVAVFAACTLHLRRAKARQSLS
ncbi:MAG: DUF2069 domain-containing protein [Betaproteobacteria bacterium]|nr:DUF2069 domain-containing protein [Betaproteobacteria bacterium]